MSAIDTLLCVRVISAPIAAAVIGAIAGGDVHGGELVRDPTWAISH